VFKKQEINLIRQITTCLAIFVITAICVLTLSSVNIAADGGELYLTNLGTYYQPDNCQKLQFIRNKYFFSENGYWYHLERLYWDFNVRSTNADNCLKKRFYASSQDIMVNKFNKINKKVSRASPSCLYILHSNRPVIDKWLNDSTYATSLIMDKNVGHQLLTESNVYPAYIGNQVISILEAYNLYAGGAHGMNGYQCHTYNLAGKEIKIKDLFTDWKAVKKSLKKNLLANWEKSAQKTAQKKSNSKAELKKIIKTIASMKAQYAEVLDKDLAETNFVFTHSAQGIRLNFFYPPYSFGSYAHGGTWISCPVKSLSSKVKHGLANWIKMQDSRHASLPDNLGYFHQKTQHYGVFPSSDTSVNEFYIGYAKLTGKDKTPAVIFEILNNSK